MSSERSPTTRFFLGIWHFIDGARKVFLNVIFLIVFFFIVAALVAARESLVVQSKTALLLQPSGRVVEEYTGTPFDRALQRASDGRLMETRLRDLLAAINRAAGDSRISVLVIDPTYLWGVGLASLQELEAAVRDFRESGKPVIAVGDIMGQQQYYLAAMADEVWLNPEGLVWLDGYAIYRSYYREALEKLSVEVNLFRAGEYKSAGEPYVRDDMSQEAREANSYWLGSLWQQYLEGVSRNRGLPLEDLSAAVNRFADRLEAADGDFAELARQMGLVDRLISQSEAFQQLALLSAPGDNGQGFRQVGVRDYLLLTDFERGESRKQKVAVVVAQGDIVHGQFERGTIGSETMIDRLRGLGRRSEVAAVVFRVDSPGGDAFASEKIRSELQALRDAGKTVVVSMGDVAASGGYWISMAADEVWASPSSITGSIGVYGLAPRFQDSLDRIGIHTDGVRTAPLAGQFDLTLSLDPELERIYRESVERIYNDFIEVVADARQMSTEAVRAVARGRVWSGSQAHDRGLVDHVGTLQQAIDSAGRIAGLGTDFTAEYDEPKLSGFETFLLEFTGGVVARTGLTGGGPDALPRKLLERLESDLALIARARGGLSIASHCLCRME